MPKPANTSRRTIKKTDTSNASGVQPEQDTTPASERRQLLVRAEECVLKERNATYGPPTQDFDRIAGMLNELYHGEFIFEAHDVAMIMIVLKLSRLRHSAGHFDNWVDIAGYAACGWECSVEESKRARGTQQ